MAGQSFKRHVKTLHVSSTTLNRDSGSMSAKRSLKSSKQLAKAKIPAKKRSLSKKSRKHKDRLSSSSEAKKPFFRTNDVDELVAGKEISMELHPDGWQVNPEFDEHHQKSHEIMVPCADTNCDKMTFSLVNTRQGIDLIIGACADFNY